MSDYNDDYWWMNGSWLPKGKYEKTKCECGTTIAMGKDDHPSYHSDWCPIRKEQDALPKQEPNPKNPWGY